MNADVQKRLHQAVALQEQGDLAGAKTLCSQILVDEPNNPDALHLSGLASLQLGKPDEAVMLIQKAVEQMPDHPVLRNNLGLAMHRAGTLVAAAGQLQKALEIQENYAGAHMNLGAVFSDLGDRESALEHGLKAVELEPERGEAWFNLGLFLLDRVELPQAIEAFRKALALQPRYAEAASSLLYTLNLLPQQDPVAVAAEHRRVSAGVYGSPPTRPARRQPNTPGETAPNTKLSIGYLSADFRRHTVNHFFEPLLEQHDRDRFHITCYSDTADQDDVTARLQGLSDHWLDCRGMDDQALSQRIREDNIDILIDLAGHTKGNRLGTLALRPAPLQLGWLGYPVHPGLEALDAQLVSDFTVQLIQDTPAASGLLPLDSPFAVFRPADDAPPVAPSPVMDRGHITLGALQRLDMINHEVVACWAHLLTELPTARLLMVHDHLDPWQRRRLLGQFAAHGIDETRLELMPGQEAGGSVQALWADIDICLDTFPWSDHTLACHALWAGVPVVTLAGQAHASRMAADTLIAMDLKDWVASDEDQYCRIVTRMAQDPERLNALRADLRNRMIDSPAMDSEAFARRFERAIAGQFEKAVA